MSQVLINTFNKIIHLRVGYAACADDYAARALWRNYEDEERKKKEKE